METRQSRTSTVGKLEPLQQWVCDECGELIEEPSHGYVEWRRTDDPPYAKYGFRIVHHALQSPNRSRGGDCYYSRQERGGDMALPESLGVKGMIHLTSWIDPGEEFLEEYDGPRVRDLREWTVLFRRLQIPHYEEARFHFAEAHADGNLGSANQVYFYLPEKGLRAILEQYGDDDH